MQLATITLKDHTGIVPGPESHAINTPRFWERWQGRWKETWSPGAGLPDVWYAIKEERGCILLEYEVSNAAIKVGQMYSARPVRDATITFQVHSDWILVDPAPRTMPTKHPTKRLHCRRLAFYPKSRPDLQSMAMTLAMGTLWSEWSTRKKAFGPLNLPLPTLANNVRTFNDQLYAARHLALKTALANQTTWTGEDGEDGVLMHINGYHPWGPLDRAAPGGSGIFHDTGWQDSVNFARYALLAHQCVMERMWVTYHKSDGRPVSCDDYGNPSPDYKPGSWDPNNHELPEFRGVQTSDVLPLPYDPAHHIRALRYAMAGYEMTGSPLCRRHLIVMAEQLRLAYPEKGPRPAYGYWPENLNNMLGVAQANPNKGGPLACGRILGWCAWAGAIRLKLAGHTPGWDSWANMMIQLAKTAAMPSGLVQRHYEPPKWADDKHDGAQSFEAGLFWPGVMAICKQMNQVVPAASIVCAETLYEDMPSLRYHGGKGPIHFVDVAHHDTATGNFDTIDHPMTGTPTDPANPGDSAHLDHYCALMASLGDPHWLTINAPMGNTPASSPTHKRSILESKTSINGEAFLLAQLQSFLG